MSNMGMLILGVFLIVVGVISIMAAESKRIDFTKAWFLPRWFFGGVWTPQEASVGRSNARAGGYGAVAMGVLAIVATVLLWDDAPESGGAAQSEAPADAVSAGDASADGPPADDAQAPEEPPGETPDEAPGFDQSASASAADELRGRLRPRRSAQEDSARPLPVTQPSEQPTVKEPLPQEPLSEVEASPPVAGYSYTEVAGSTGGTTFEDLGPEGSLMVGIQIFHDDFQGQAVIKSVQPLFELAGQQVPGKRHGGSGGTKQYVIAKDGYAIGAIDAKADDVLHGFKVIFMRTKAGRLNPTFFYKSDWLGAGSSVGTLRIGGNGKPVVGIRGSCGDHVNGLGLILAR